MLNNKSGFDSRHAGRRPGGKVPVRAGFNSRHETCAIPAAPCAQTHKKNWYPWASVFPSLMGTIISSGYAVGEGEYSPPMELLWTGTQVV